MLFLHLDPALPPRNLLPRDQPPVPAPPSLNPEAFAFTPGRSWAAAYRTEIDRLFAALEGSPGGSVDQLAEAARKALQLQPHMTAAEWAATCSGLAKALGRLQAGPADFTPDRLVVLLRIACQGSDPSSAVAALREQLIPACGRLRDGLSERWRVGDWRATEALLVAASQLPPSLAAPILSSMHEAARSVSRQAFGPADDPALESRLLELFATLAEAHPGPELPGVLDALLGTAGFSRSIRVFGAQAGDCASIWRRQAQRLRTEDGGSPELPLIFNPGGSPVGGRPTSRSPAENYIHWDELHQTLQASIQADSRGDPVPLGEAFVACWKATRWQEFPQGSAQALEMARLTEHLASAMVSRPGVNIRQLVTISEMLTRMDARDITPETRRCVMRALHGVDFSQQKSMDHLIREFRARVIRLVRGIGHMAEPGSMNQLLTALQPLVTSDAEYLRGAILEQNRNRLASRGLPPELSGLLSQDLSMPLTDQLWDLTAALQSGRADIPQVAAYVGNLARQLELPRPPAPGNLSARAYAEQLEAYAMRLQASMCGGRFLTYVGETVSLNVHDNNLNASVAMVDWSLRNLPAHMREMVVTVGNDTHGGGGPRLSAAVEGLARTHGFSHRRDGRFIRISRESRGDR